MNKYIKIGDLYFEILELCDYYNLENKLKPYIHDIFEMAITCTLQRQSWRKSGIHRQDSCRRHKLQQRYKIPFM